MTGESNQNVFLIQKDASSFAEFEISEFEIARVDCMFYWQCFHSDVISLDTRVGPRETASIISREADSLLP